MEETIYKKRGKFIDKKLSETFKVKKKASKPLLLPPLFPEYNYACGGKIAVDDQVLSRKRTIEGSVIPVDQSLAARMHATVSDVNTNEQTAVSTVPVIPIQTPATKTGNIVANYKKPYAMSRRAFTSPTILVKHGNKVQRVMVSSTTPTTLYNGQVLSASDSAEDYVRYTPLPPQPPN